MSCRQTLFISTNTNFSSASLSQDGIGDEHTLIIFSSDNGGVHSRMFSGNTKVEGDLPASNGPNRDRKSTTYEGGTLVAAFANWPGHIKAGKVNQTMHVVDWYPTIAKLAGLKPTKNKPLDGMDLQPTVSTGAASSRREMLYNVDPMGGALRVGDWKLVWKA